MLCREEEATLREHGEVARVRFGDYELCFRRNPGSAYWQQTIYTHNRRRGYCVKNPDPTGSMSCFSRKHMDRELEYGEFVPSEVFRICARAARNLFWDHLSGRR